MRILADEGVDRQIVERLRLDGHDVLYVAETTPGAEDKRILMVAEGLRMTLLTQDKDFGDLVFRQGYDDHVHEIEGSFCVITPSAIRVRRLSDDQTG